MDSYNPINMAREISTLNRKFDSVTKHFGNNNLKGTQLHEIQVDFAYKINKLKYAPDHVAHKMVYNTYQFVNDILDTKED